MKAHIWWISNRDLQDHNFPFTDFPRYRKYQEQRRKKMERLKQPKNQALYEKYKAQARERTRRYRARIREERIRLQKQQAALNESMLEQMQQSASSEPTELKFQPFRTFKSENDVHAVK